MRATLALAILALILALAIGGTVKAAWRAAVVPLAVIAHGE